MVTVGPILSLGPYNPLVVVEHSNVTLKCNVRANPAVSNVAWYKDGTQAGNLKLFNILAYSNACK